MNPDDYLQMSGIQHFCFCRRQWALAYMEQQWAENLRTAAGRLLHERCHDDSLREKRGDLITVRDLRVVSHRLRLAGNCDVVEFRAAPDGVALQGYDGLWQPLPVEYKRGAPKASDADRLQVCAQAMALEEMLAWKAGPRPYPHWLDAFCQRKYESGFSREMNRSAAEYLKAFPWKEEAT